uniref:RRM domain-containing protein n=1 Tax=Periophthalmus magnuspinnatus TaxID=409849 RepID=A0A3B4B2N9_9GOBI
MAVVIRLQGLPIVAGTMDIRHFFSGLTIPDGGVHIVGGEHGEAFIVFATDEDARLGMMRTGGAIKGSKVSLLLSSKTEMQNTIELSRRRFDAQPMQNLPYSCSEAELRDFFRGGAVEGVRFMRDAQGRSTGRALVRFFSAQDSYEALKRGGGPLGQRYIEVSPASERQWNSVSEKEMEPQERGRLAQGGAPREQRGRSRSPHRQDLCVYLKGLPYEVDKNQVKEFFKNLSVVEDSMYIAYGPNGKATGEGFVEFCSEQDYKSALGAHMQYMGARFIQVHPITRKGMMDKIEQIRKRDSESKSSDSTRAPKTCLHITNIPYNVSRKDVRGFLEGLGLYEDSLKVLTDAHGNGLGQAVVQLRSEEDARKAERLHRQKLNGPVQGSAHKPTSPVPT